MDKILVERVRFDTASHDNYNNSYPKDPNDLEIINLDYDTEVKKTNLLNYADIINYPIDWSYSFTNDEQKILLNYSNNCIKLGNIDNCQNELKPIIQRLDDNWPLDKKTYFFRFNSKSPKDGIPNYPIVNGLQVITKIVTSSRARLCLMDNETTLYFTLYDLEWNIKCEFRVFIYHRKITCISQYSVINKSILSGKSNNECKNLALIIKNHLENKIIELVCDKIDTNNVVCDIYLLPDMKCKIIEFNSFGYWLAAGSSLFHWINDKSKLYNTDDIIYLRIIK